MDFLKKQWFFVGIVVVFALASLAPDIGMFIRNYNILKIGIFLTFLATGTLLDTSDVFRQLKDYKVMLAAILSSLIFFPFVTDIVASAFFRGQDDFIIGSIVIAAVPVTIASGTVMTGIARGNIPLSLCICVLCNGIAIFTIPPVLKLLVSGMDAIEFSLLKMMGNLVLTVLIPIIIGQLLQPTLKIFANNHRKKISVFNQCVVLLIIFNALAGSITKFAAAGDTIICAVVFMIILHNCFLLFNYWLARMIKLDRPSISAFTIHTSQKTLAVSYLIWAGYLADTYPLALLPCIAYHLIQSICDTLLAEQFRKRADTLQTSMLNTR